MVENLSFVLKKGESLLLTGHNGAGSPYSLSSSFPPHLPLLILLPLPPLGKSSIFRCLGGLWNAEGTIIKPGSAESGLHQEVYYLPQKPYTVLGTLADQLTYPGKEGGKGRREGEGEGEGGGVVKFDFWSDNYFF